MAQSQNTVKEVFIDVVGTVAGDADLAAFRASGGEGEVAILPAGDTGAVAVGAPFVIATKIGGEVIVSDVYTSAQITSARSVAYAAPALRSIDITPTNTTVGTEYVLNLRISNFGSLSPENFYMKHAYHKVVTGDTVATIIDGLVSSLNKNFSREPGATASSNPYFTFTDNTTKLTITEKDQALKLGKDEGRPLVFDVTVDYVSGASIATIAVAEGGSVGVGTGKQVAIMEDFYRGNRGDAFGDQHFPYNWGKATKSQATVANKYALIELTAVHSQNEQFNPATSRKQCMIAVDVTSPGPGTTGDYTAFNAFLTKLNAFLPTEKEAAALSVTA